MVLGLLIKRVALYWAPKNVKLVLGFAVLDPVKYMSMDFDHFCLSVPLEKASAGVLLV